MERPLACWEGQDRYGQDILPSLTVILKTSGCRHNRCRMCSYRFERYREAEDMASLIISQLRWVRDHHDLDRIQMVKIYTSGSFFDPAEVPHSAAREAADLFAGKLLIAETRPEFVDSSRIEDFVARIDSGEWKVPLTVAIGLETVTDSIREKSIDKGFSWQDFLDAVGEARKGGAGIKAYLLHKPLFLTEAEALQDMERSIRDLNGVADMISMNPCTVQRMTELEYYWKRNSYRPPYLWSVLKILLSAPHFVSCDPVGGGHARGPHNCGGCDPDLVKAIREYNLSADRGLLAEAIKQECRCREEWEFVLSQEAPYALPLTR
jgi:radical SAM enzyme (TIGR01210 family)